MLALLVAFLSNCFSKSYFRDRYGAPMPEATNEIIHFDNFSSWLNLADTAVPITSNQPALAMPFQRWFKFKEAFAPSFVFEIIESLPHRPTMCLDPFGGSGTTALTCQFLGIQPVTIEVNPFMADVIEAKLTRYDVSSLQKDYDNILRQASRDWHNINLNCYFREAPKTFVEPGVDDRWVFNRDVAKSIASIRREIDWLKDPSHKRFFKVMLGSLLIDLSNVRVNGKGRRYRNGWTKRTTSANDVFAYFITACEEAFSDLKEFGARPPVEFKVLRGDARKLVDTVQNIDVVLTSPPYPNSFDYTDIYNVELWSLGYLQRWCDNRQLRKSTIRSHVQIAHQGEPAVHLSPTLLDVYSALDLIRGELWNKRIPEMVCHYFEDMRQVLSGCKSALNEGGQIIMAVGDSCYEGVHIDVAGILGEIGQGLGLQEIQNQSVRTMRASAQQGGDFALNESLVWLAT